MSYELAANDDILLADMFRSPSTWKKPIDAVGILILQKHSTYTVDVSSIITRDHLQLSGRVH